MILSSALDLSTRVYGLLHRVEDRLRLVHGGYWRGRMRPSCPLGYRGRLELLELLALESLFFTLPIAMALNEEPDKNAHQQHHYHWDNDCFEEDFSQAHRAG